MTAFFRCCSRSPHRADHIAPIIQAKAATAEPALEADRGHGAALFPAIVPANVYRNGDPAEEARRLILDPAYTPPDLERPAAPPSRQTRGSAFTMLVSLAVLLYEGVAYNIVFLGRLLPDSDRNLRIPVLLLLFNLLWGMALWSYLCAHLADPGIVPSAWREFVAKVGPELDVITARLEWQPGKSTICKKCNSPRPERTHHCHVCGVCVLRMDHHCPWINNCVGFRNYKQFLLLVVYCILAAVFALLTSLPEMLECAAQLWRILDGTQQDHLTVKPGDVVAMLAFGIVALVFLSLLLPMVGTHVLLAIQNSTSIESHYDEDMSNPFDLRSPVANLEQVFGECGWDWLVPIESQRPISDGIAFRRFGDAPGQTEPIDASQLNLMALSERERRWRRIYGIDTMKALDASLENQRAEFSPLTHLVRWWKPHDLADGTGNATPSGDLPFGYVKPVTHPA